MLCLLEAEGGLDFRQMHDMYMALFCKLWWIFKTKTSIWQEFLINKYCEKLNPNEAVWELSEGGYQLWKKM